MTMAPATKELIAIMVEGLLDVHEGATKTCEHQEWDEGNDYIVCRAETHEDFTNLANTLALFNITAKIDTDLGDGMTYFTVDLPQPRDITPC